MDHDPRYVLIYEGATSSQWPDIAVKILNTLKDGKDPENTELNLRGMELMSRDPAVCSKIHESNGIQILVGFVDNPQEPVSFYAVKTLRNLLVYQDGYKLDICKVGGLQKMVELLKSSTEELLVIVLHCLGRFIDGNQENKQLFITCNGPAELIRIMRTYTSENLLCTTVRFLTSLSTDSSSKRAVIAAEGVQALASHLDNQCQELIVECLFALRNLSDEVGNQESDSIAPVLPILVQHLGSSNKIIVNYTIGMFTNLICNNAHNKMIVCQEKGIGALLNVISKAGNNEEITMRAIFSLFHLTRQHPEEEKARNDVLSELEVIVKFLKSSYSWPVIYAAVRLVGNLTNCPSSHEALITLGTVNTLSNTLHSAHRDILKNRETLSQDEAQPTVVEEHIVMKCIANILHIFLKLAPNVKAKALLKNPNTINTLEQILNKETENFECVIIEIFRQISSDTDDTSVLESGVSVLSLNSSVSSATEIVLFSKDDGNIPQN